MSPLDGTFAIPGFHPLIFETTVLDKTLEAGKPVSIFVTT
jgi:hypothetical protein